MNGNQTDGKQAKLWNGQAGQAWVESQEMLDRMFKPFEEVLVDWVGSRRVSHVLDVGCGAGSTTLGTARRLGAGSRCTGIDISEPMLAAARSRATGEGVAAEFIRADAQSHVFEAKTYDAIISRFGVMFFADPVRAFSNLREAARPGAGLHFIAWRGPEDNPFMTVAERVAVSLLPGVPAREPDGPGQFGFANRDRVREIVKGGGWSEIDIRPLNVECGFPASQLTSYFTRFGPVGQALQDTDESTRQRVIGAVHDAFASYIRGNQVVFNAACWSVVAVAT